MNPTSSSTVYRKVSGLALAAFIVSVCSLLVLVSPLLLVIPLLALFLAALALRAINLQPDSISGKFLVYAAFAISAFFLAYAPARSSFRSRSLEPPTQDIANAFLTFLQQAKWHEAHQLTTRKFLLRDPARSLADYYKDDPAALQEYNLFLESPAMKKLLPLGKAFDFAFESYAPGVNGRGNDLLTVCYRVTPSGSGSKRSFPVWFQVMRSVDEQSGDPNWKLTEIRLTDPKLGYR